MTIRKTGAGEITEPDDLAGEDQDQETPREGARTAARRPEHRPWAGDDEAALSRESAE